MKLLNVDANAKTVKGQKKGYMTAILYLAPWKLSGYQVCAMAEIAGCIADCLNTAGHGGMFKPDAETMLIDGQVFKLNTVQRCRIARTRFFFEDRAGFMKQLCKEIHNALKLAAKKGLELVVRLNGTSDIRWEDIIVANNKNIFEVFSGVQFYDYTKIPNRKIAGIKNYHLTFSYSARNEFNKIFDKALANYGTAVNYAVVFQGKMLPDEFNGRAVINGDETDLRFTDPTGMVVGLRAKGKAKKSTSGFGVQLPLAA